MKVLSGKDTFGSKILIIMFLPIIQFQQQAKLGTAFAILQFALVSLTRRKKHWKICWTSLDSTPLHNSLLPLILVKKSNVTFPNTQRNFRIQLGGKKRLGGSMWGLISSFEDGTTAAYCLSQTLGCLPLITVFQHKFQRPVNWPSLSRRPKSCLCAFLGWSTSCSGGRSLVSLEKTYMQLSCWDPLAK